MLKNSFGIKYFLALAFLLLAVPIVIPIKAWGGVEVVNTDNLGPQLYYFWDLRNRETFFQVTNASAGSVQVHVQVFNAGTTNCAEFDFFDSFTPNDTHLYNVRKLDANDGSLSGPPTLDNGFGFVAVTVVEPNPGFETTVLIGNFRIIDGSGYEYRTNAANLEGNDFIPGFKQFTFNFNDVGSTASDVVGIVATDSGEFGGPQLENSVDARPDLSVTLTPTLYNDKENPISCPPVTFACSPTAFDLGINEAIPNSRDGSHICLGTATKGFVALSNYHDNFDHSLDTSGDKSTHRLEGHFVGFIGLNSGRGKGTMDSFWSIDGSKTSESPAPLPLAQQ